MNESSIISSVNDADYEYQVTIQELFEKQAVKTPDETALIFEQSRMTYKELDDTSNAVAWKLRESGVQNQDIVIIIANRSLEMIIGIYGIIKAGAAYLPISMDCPINRIQYIIKESKCRYILCEKEMFSKLDCDIKHFDLMDNTLYQGNYNGLPLVNNSDSLAYVIYTSGSTGNPKGVMIKHSSLVNRLLWMQDKYPIDRTDTLIQKTPFTFDVSVWEIFWWSITGAKLLIMKPMMEKFPQAIIQNVSDQHVTVMHFVPSMMDVFLKYVYAGSEAGSLKSLRKIFCSGEKLTIHQVKQFNEILYRENGTTLTNLYGPTETAIDVTYYDCKTEGEFDTIPIGKPIYNTKIVIINDQNELAAIGEKGEICILGAGLSTGYLNREDLTNEAFVRTNLFHDAVMYKTGDIGCFLPDGNIEYIGRMDNQVKIRGLRIELSEIEKVIESYPLCKKSIVVTSKMNDANVLINAFVVADRHLELRQLKAYLKEHLLPYTIPNNIVILDKVPLNHNGKADRKKLSAVIVRNNKVLQGEIE